MSIRLSDIVMEFPGTRALDHVTADFRFDEVHGLIGENGAGKSTFVNILGGSLRPTAGRIEMAGSLVSFDSPRAALAAGIAHVSQEGSLVPGLTGAENILLGNEPRRFGVIARARLRAEAASLVNRWFPGIDLSLDRPVGDLPMAERKVIEIVRALRSDLRLVILDEPTATLEAREKRQLWSIIRALPKGGVGVVLISHFLGEVRALSDRITVLRDGRHVATRDAAGTTEADLAELMLRRGAAAAAVTNRGAKAGAATVLEVAGWRAGEVEVPQFSLKAGEIVGLIGLTGAGHFGFARSLFMPAGVDAGTISIDGRKVAASGVRAMRDAGIALIPDHRMENALIGEGTVRENLALVHPGFAASGGVLLAGRERAEADRVMKLLNVKAHGQGQTIRTLSGGNKQKVSIGKWLYGAADRYRVLIFIEPTEGVDVGAKREIYAQMRRLAGEGAAILIASSDLGEIAEVADRAIAFVHGRPVREIAAADFSEPTFIAAISGDAP